MKIEYNGKTYKVRHMPRKNQLPCRLCDVGEFCTHHLINDFLFTLPCEGLKFHAYLKEEVL